MPVKPSKPRVDPGATRTAMRAAAYPGEDPQTVKPAEDLLPLFLSLSSADEIRHGALLMG
jgi:hypothetical protein